VVQKKTLVFFGRSQKITKKQCLFDKNIVLVFLFDGAVRPHEPSFSERTSTAACFFFSSGRKPPQRSGAREKVSGRPFFPIGALSSDKKIRPRRPGSKKKIVFLVREARRTMDASPAFMEYRSVKKDRGLNRRTRDFLAQNVGASKNTRRSMSFLRRRAHRADTLLYGGLKKIGEGWWWWWLKCGSVNFFCVNGMRDTAKHSSAKRKNRFYTQPLF
jgi:hypothetical protein